MRTLVWACLTLPHRTAHRDMEWTVLTTHSPVTSYVIQAMWESISETDRLCMPPTREPALSYPMQITEISLQSEESSKAGIAVEKNRKTAVPHYKRGTAYLIVCMMGKRLIWRRNIQLPVSPGLKCVWKLFSGRCASRFMAEAEWGSIVGYVDGMRAKSEM